MGFDCIWNQSIVACVPAPLPDTRVELGTVKRTSAAGLSYRKINSACSEQRLFRICFRSPRAWQQAAHRITFQSSKTNLRSIITIHHPKDPFTVYPFITLNINSSYLSLYHYSQSASATFWHHVKFRQVTCWRCCSNRPWFADAPADEHLRMRQWLSIY